MSKVKIQTPLGMGDILEQEWEYYGYIEKIASKVARVWHFQRIETPILEFCELFKRGVGEGTDIVEKEMYSLRTKGGDLLCLRPEGTAPVVRAYFENGMESWPQPVRLWYFGPFFRHDKPQANRRRQFWQFGFEILNAKEPILDALILKIFFDIFEELKIEGVNLYLNSIGCENCRPYFKKVLTQYFKTQESSLCQNCKRRLKINPFRILDCKEEKCKIISAKAPQSLDYFCQECKNYFKKLLEILEELKIPYYLDPHLVRGLDYYLGVVFEFRKEKLELAGGGGYELGKIVAKKSLPGVGGAAGVERIVGLLREKNFSIKRKSPKVFLAVIGEEAKIKGLKIIQEWAKEKIYVMDGIGKESLKSQLRLAEKMGAKYVLILGEKETKEGSVLFKDMEKGKQELISLKVAKNRVKKLHL